MFERIHFKNFKALKDAEVKLGPFNLVVGPNGSGKSSLLQAFEMLANPNSFHHRALATLGSGGSKFSIAVCVPELRQGEWITLVTVDRGSSWHFETTKLALPSGLEMERNTRFFASARVYALEPARMSQPVQPNYIKELLRDGSNLAGALTYIRDQDEDAYDHLREELQRWLPEFDSIGFTNDQNGYRSLYLRQAGTRQQIPATELSEGTLLALALLAIVHQPGAPTLIGLEEPDRGLHPRLLREVRDALYRISFPSDFGIKRQPVQVIATTHSPLFLDLFKDHPEQIIIAEKNADGSATFKNLSEDKQLQEMIGDAPLGEVWYSGVLGGVPALK